MASLNRTESLPQTLIKLYPNKKYAIFGRNKDSWVVAEEMEREYGCGRSAYRDDDARNRNHVKKAKSNGRERVYSYKFALHFLEKRCVQRLNVCCKDFV